MALGRTMKYLEAFKIIFCIWDLEEIPYEINRHGEHYDIELSNESAQKYFVDEYEEELK